MTPRTLDEVQAAGGYQVLYLDPPWAFVQKVRVTLDEAQYSTMSQADLIALPVRQLAAKDCAMFIWCTWPHVAEGALHDVIRAWGFELKTIAFLWVKRNAKAGSLFWGAGSWTRANTEPCFLAVRGKPRRVDAGVHQVLEDFVSEDVLDAARPTDESGAPIHSAKPPIVRDRIMQLMGPVKAIELFARERDPAGRLDAWGDDPRLGGSDVILVAPTKASPLVLAPITPAISWGNDFVDVVHSADAHTNGTSSLVRYDLLEHLFLHPIWERVKPYAHPTNYGRFFRLDFLHLPEEMRAEALAVETRCMSCGVAVHPLRARAKSGRSRIAGTEVEWRLFYAAACPQDVNPGCTRTRASQRHTEWVRDMFAAARPVTAASPAPEPPTQEAIDWGAS